jgi:uncharacterized protein YndB with AHSA1/START domain
MSRTTIERDISIDAPIEIVWRTVTEPELVRTWFSAAADFVARPGAVGTLTFAREGADEPMIVDITVVAADHPHTFSFRWVYPLGVEPVEGNSMLVTFTLTADGDERTRLHVVETGLDALDWSDDDKDRYVEQHRHGWEAHGDKLRQLLSSRPGP